MGYEAMRKLRNLGLRIHSGFRAFVHEAKQEVEQEQRTTGHTKGYNTWLAVQSLRTKGYSNKQISEKLEISSSHTSKLVNRTASFYNR